MKKETKLKLLPLIMTAIVVAVDQFTKLLITRFLAENASVEVLGDFFRITHRKNPFIIFSLGGNLPPFFQTLVFFILPAVAIALLTFFYFREKDLKQVYRLPLAAILGGGLGNLLDRLFRAGGVIDFLDFKFFGILGFQRWPTFNVSDMSIVLSVMAIIIIGVVAAIRKRRKKTEATPT